MPRECRKLAEEIRTAGSSEILDGKGSMAMQILRFSRVLTGTLFLVASGLSYATFPALGKASIRHNRL